MSTGKREPRRRALADLVASGSRRAAYGSGRDAQAPARTLYRQLFHALHYIGHCIRDIESGRGLLLFLMNGLGEPSQRRDAGVRRQHQAEVIAADRLQVAAPAVDVRAAVTHSAEVAELLGSARST